MARTTTASTPRRSRRSPSPAVTPTAATSTSRSRPAGGRNWVFLFSRHGKRHERLGSAARGLARRARELAAEARQKLEAGENPKRPGGTTGEASFAACAEHLIASLRPSWRSALHAQQWRDTLTEGRGAARAPSRRQDHDRGRARVLAPIWQTKRTTAERLRGRIERVLDAAKARGLTPDLREPGPLARPPRPHPAEAPARGAAASRRAAVRGGAGVHARAAGARRRGRAGARVHDPDRGAVGRGASARAGTRSTSTQETWTIPGERMKSGPDASRAAVARGARGPQAPARGARERVRVSRALRGHHSTAAAMRKAARASMKIGRHRARLPLRLPRLGGGEDELPARGLRAGAGAHGRQRGRARLSAHRRVREAAPAHGGVGRVLHRRARHGAGIPGARLAMRAPLVGAKRGPAALELREPPTHCPVSQRSACHYPSSRSCSGPAPPDRRGAGRSPARPHARTLAPRRAGRSAGDARAGNPVPRPGASQAPPRLAQGRPRAHKAKAANGAADVEDYSVVRRRRYAEKRAAERAAKAARQQPTATQPETACGNRRASRPKRSGTTPASSRRKSRGAPSCASSTSRTAPLARRCGPRRCRRGLPLQPWRGS